MAAGLGLGAGQGTALDSRTLCAGDAQASSSGEFVRVRLGKQNSDL